MRTPAWRLLTRSRECVGVARWCVILFISDVDSGGGVGYMKGGESSR